MKSIALSLCCGLAIGAAADVPADDAFDRYTGVTLNAARSTEGGVRNISGGLSGLISARYPSKHYGFELQGGYFGRSGKYSANAEIDLCAMALLPLGGSGIQLYGKAGGADVFSTSFANNVNITYGMGVEYLFSRTVLRVGVQHFNVGGPGRTSVRTNLIGVTLMVKQ